MAIIYNSELTREIQKAAGLQQLNDVTPIKLGDTVIPVIEVNPRLTRNTNMVFNGTASNSTSNTLVTLSSTKEFYLTSLNLSIIKDATSTSAVSHIEITLDSGELVIPLAIASITLNAQSETANQNYMVQPIKLKKGSTITVNNSTNVANIVARAQATGYYVEFPIPS